ncbi:hypothetical protein QOZ80_5AG0401810 [Eleusine coracana subsp. coracana]|nr:hypothetical protein QOZ80_5AG0401810 [Eleusine coracana subsp. coracana]
METMMPSVPPQPKTGGIGRRLARLLRRKRTPSGAEMAYSVAGDEFDQSLDSSINSLSKLKLSGNLAAAYSFDAFFRNNAEKKVPEKKAPAAAAEKGNVPDDAAKHAFAASLFAGASAVKAAYARMQVAQHPYDAAAIQAADAGVVAELMWLSDLKRRYARDPAAAAARSAAAASLASLQADEQRHLLCTYEVTARKLEAELRLRDAQAAALRRALNEEEELEQQRNRNRIPGPLDGLHLSGLNATHFLTALRHAAKSVRAFSKTLLDAMGPAGWDPVAAAAAVHPGAELGHPSDARFAFESYVALKMFASFHRKDLGMGALLQVRESLDRRAFFEEFAELKSAPASSFLESSRAGGKHQRWAPFREFLRERYVSVVHERMEAAFFRGRVEQHHRAAVEAFPRTPWFDGFAEMARRVWLLHCLFHAFEAGSASVFQARPGSRFSEVYMESVGAGDDDLAVGFTVVPGFKVGQTVIQCRVYLSARPDHRQRS